MWECQTLMGWFCWGAGVNEEVGCRRELLGCDVTRLEFCLFVRISSGHLRVNFNTSY